MLSPACGMLVAIHAQPGLRHAGGYPCSARPAACWWLSMLSPACGMLVAYNHNALYSFVIMLMRLYPYLCKESKYIFILFNPL
jgi:hypothetical protein